MPRAINDRLQLKHHTDGPPTVWFTLGRTLLRPYLLCLLNSEELRQKYGVQSIPHYSFKPLTDYNDLLKGKMFDPADNSRRSAKLALKLVPEFGDGDDDALALEDGPAEGMPDLTDENFDAVDLDSALAQVIEEALAQEEQQAAEELAEKEEADSIVHDQDVQEDKKYRGTLKKMEWGCFTIAKIRGGQAFEARRCFHAKNSKT